MPVPSAVLALRDLAAKWAAANPPLSADEILAIVWSESTGNPQAYNPGDPSWGLMQVTTLIASAYGKYDPADTSWHFDPDKNMGCGSAFLADLKRRYSPNYPDYWVAAYNCGEGQFIRGFMDPLYVTAFQRHMAALEPIPAVVVSDPELGL